MRTQTDTALNLEILLTHIFNAYEKNRIINWQFKGTAWRKKDIDRQKQFLESDHGDQWTDDEIIISMNPAKYSLLLTINRIKASRPDFAIAFYSGHGTYQKTLFQKSMKMKKS